MRVNGKLSVVMMALAAYLLVPAGRAMASDDPRSTLSIQGGWWNAEVEWKSKRGLYAAVGVPWFAMVLSADAQWILPYGARLGYQHEVSPAFKVRGAVHFAGTYGRENPCGGCGEIVSRTFGFAEIGGRYEAPSGFVAGLDVPLFGFGKHGRDLYWPPVVFAFTQVYVGFAWRWP